MIISKLRTNHIEAPMGHTLSPLTLSWVTDGLGTKEAEVQVLIARDEDFEDLVFDSGVGQLDSISYYPNFEPDPRTRYYWSVEVTSDQGDRGYARSFFETGKMNEAWTSTWIKAPFDDAPLICKAFELSDVRDARLYIVGMGIYEIYCNGTKVGEEYLAPGHHSYDFWLQSHTYDLTDHLIQGGNVLGVILGDGWYKGRFGWDGQYYNHYGKDLMMTAEVHLTMKDGSSHVMTTDETWQCHKNPVTKSDIYYGEDYDANLEIENWSLAKEGNRDHFLYVQRVELPPQQPLVDRYSLPIKQFERFKPRIIHTPKKEIVLDFGQNLAGWVEGDIHLPKGSRLKLTYGELLQEGCFYNDNLRTAEAQYSFISNGKKAHFRPHFTYYGFRYVKVEGLEDLASLETFRSIALYSDMAQTGTIETSNPKVNRLIANAFWSQKSNFVDVPTDCPQRDERMGWTGDAQVFADTASFNMYTPAFYNKYMKDLMLEQKALDGGVPYVVPLIKSPHEKSILKQHSSCAWGDVATILPWTLYTHFGDLALLAQHYPAMKDWVDYIERQVDQEGGNGLWQTGFHFADWLALDNYKDPTSCMGGTDNYFIASAYYAYSSDLTAKAAKVLGKMEDYTYYQKLSREIKNAITQEYFTPAGRSAIDTQTALVVALYMDLVPATFRPRLIGDLEDKLKANNMHLSTGFVGTPYLCKTLSDNGLNHMAYTLLLNEDLPGWLYEVNLGATTIWERWNSVLPDGTISGTGMNSMNHYAYGSILEWMYRYMCGFVPLTCSPGFRKIMIKPMPDPRFTYVKGTIESPVGTYKSAWTYHEASITYTITVPFGGEADLYLSGQEPRLLSAGTYTYTVE